MSQKNIQETGNSYGIDKSKLRGDHKIYDFHMNWKTFRQVVCFVSICIASVDGLCPWWIVVLSLGCCGFFNIVSVDGNGIV